MPRGSRSSGRRAASPAPASRQSVAATRPMPAQTQPAKTTIGGGILSGIGSTIMQGMAFGAGSEVAHQAVRSVMGGSHQSQQVQPQQVQSQSQQQLNPCQP